MTLARYNLLLPGKNSSLELAYGSSRLRLLAGANEDIACFGDCFLCPELVQENQKRPLFNQPAAPTHVSIRTRVSVRFNWNTFPTTKQAMASEVLENATVLDQGGMEADNASNLTGRDAATPMGIVITYSALFSMALGPILIGSIRSVPYHSSMKVSVVWDQLHPLTCTTCAI